MWNECATRNLHVCVWINRRKDSRCKDVSHQKSACMHVNQHMRVYKFVCYPKSVLMYLNIYMRTFLHIYIPVNIYLHTFYMRIHSNLTCSSVNMCVSRDLYVCIWICVHSHQKPACMHLNMCTPWSESCMHAWEAAHVHL